MQPGQMAYDRAITVFSPDGRLFQVEYAREAVKRGTTTVGLKFKDGVVLIVDKRIASRLMEPKSIEKIFQIDHHIGCATSGLVADARILVDQARVIAQINKITYDENMGVEELVKRICDLQAELHPVWGRQAVRYRPPGGWAWTIMGEHLFETDPSGALVSYKAGSIGAGRNAVMEVFEEQYQEGMAQEEAIVLGLKALKKATEEEKLNPKAVEIGIVSTRRELPPLGQTPKSKRTSKRSTPPESGSVMVDIEDAIIARLESHGETFEVLIDPKVVNRSREGKDVNLYEYMVIDEIFKNAHKGTRASEEKIKEVFGTTEPDRGRQADHPQGRGAAHRPATQGDAGEQEEAHHRLEIAQQRHQPSDRWTAHRQPASRRRWRRRRCISTRSSRSSMQIKDVLDKLRPIIPIRFDKMRIAVKLTGTSMDAATRISSISARSRRKNGSRTAAGSAWWRSPRA